MPRSANGCSDASSDPGVSSTAITNEVLSARPRSASLDPDRRELREVLLLGLDALGEDGEARG